MPINRSIRTTSNTFLTRITLNKEMATPEIWQRRFTRAAGPDQDILLSASQLQQRKDRFGQFLQQDSHWTLNTLDGILSYYYSRYCPWKG